MGSGGTRVKTGIVIGTGADLDVRTVGFRPDVVELINLDSDDKLKWAAGMADANGHKTVAAGTSTLITTLGITPLSNGFRIGADTDINVADESVCWIAHE